MLCHLMIWTILLLSGQRISRAQKTGLKLNIREIPLNPFNTSDGNCGCFWQLSLKFNDFSPSSIYLPSIFSIHLHSSSISCDHLRPHSISFDETEVLEVGVMLFIIDLEAFKELEMDYRIDYLMRQIWWPHSNCSYIVTT